MALFVDNAPFLIAIDFDGTIKKGGVYDKDWESWEIQPGFLEFYNEFSLRNDCFLFLWTCRNLEDVKEWEPVLKFLTSNGIFLLPPNRIKVPRLQELMFFSDSQMKVFADIYIDDLSFGIPKVKIGEDLCLDWEKIILGVRSILDRSVEVL